MRRYLLLLLLAALVFAAPAVAAPNGNFLISCAYDHSAQDDPIVFPGMPGASHLHSFLGVPGIGAFSTTADLIGHSTRCQVGAETAAVWHPAMITPAGVVNPTSVGIYYRATGVPVYPLPLGLRHVQGNPHNRSASSYAATWRCLDSNTNTATVPSDCRGQGMEESIYFPGCWDGESINPPSHHPLVACTSTNIRLPSIQLLLKWPAAAVGGDLSSDLDEGVTRGLTAHADYWFGADPIWFAKVVERCLNAGLSCRANNGAIVDFGAAGPKPVVISGAESDGVQP